jgi:alpha-beta hydrolase superfamily lysophospholipase
VVFRVESLRTGRNNDLAARLWTDGQPKCGVVIIVHGLGDHSDRFSSLASELTRNGWAVLAFDLPGHGLSAPRRPSKKQGQVGRFDDVLADLASVRQTMTERFPDASHVILGHSMGGNLALNYVLRHGEWSHAANGQVRGLVLLAPMIMPPNPPPRPIIFAAWLTGYLLPWICIRRHVELAKLTRDQEEANLIRDDELMHSRISLYLATQLLSQGRWALDHARQVDAPTLIMYGQSDTLIDTSACEHLAIRIGDHATRVTWPAAQHDLLHDLDRTEVIDRLLAWLSER